MLHKVLLTGIAFVAFGLTKFVFNILVIRRFSPTVLGEINQVLSVFLLVPILYAPGLGQVVSKFASEFLGANEARKSKQIFSLSFVLVAAAAIVGTIIVLILFRHLRGAIEVDRATLFALAPMLVLYSLYVVLRASYYGFDRITLYLRNEIVSSTVFFLVLAAALVTRSRLLAVLPFASHSVVFVATAIYHLRDQFCFRAVLAGVALDLRRCAHFFFCTIINSLAGPGAFHLGIILSGRLTGDPDIVAYYSVLLYSLQPLNLLPIAMVTVLMPTISRHHGAGQTEAGVTTSEQAFRPLFLVMTLIWGGGVILGWEAVRAVSGTATGELIVAFEVVLFAMYFSLILAPPSILLNATEHIAVNAWGGAIWAAIATALWWGALPRYGLLAAAAGYGVLQVGKGLWALGAARLILRWRARLGWSAVLTALAILALGAVSLTSATRLLHLAIAVLFVGLFLVLYARTLKDYMGQLVAEARSRAPKT